MRSSQTAEYPETVEPESGQESLEELVDKLLRDQDYLLAQEIKHRITELNMLLEQAHKQGLRLSISASPSAEGRAEEAVRLFLKIFREI